MAASKPVMAGALAWDMLGSEDGAQPHSSAMAAVSTSDLGLMVISSPLGGMGAAFCRVAAHVFQMRGRRKRSLGLRGIVNSCGRCPSGGGDEPAALDRRRGVVERLAEAAQHLVDFIRRDDERRAERHAVAHGADDEAG